MKLHEYIRRYRELSSMTQSMFAEEICNNTNGKVRPTIGVINGIERGGSITDENLYDYLHKEFLFIDPRKNNMLASISYDLAEHCAGKGIDLDYKKLFSCITLYDIHEYLESVVDDIEAISPKNNSVFYLMSDVVDIKCDQSILNSYVINDTAVFVFNLCFWYFLLTTDDECNIGKDEYSSEEFAITAETFGFHEFTTTSEKAKGKIARTIGRRLSIHNHYIALTESIDLNSYYDENILKAYAPSIQRLYKDFNDFFNEATIEEDTYNSIISMATDGIKEDNDDAAGILMNLYRIRNLLFNLYSFFQGRFICPSPKYIKWLCDKFDSENIYDVNPGLHNTINALTNDFNDIMRNHKESLSNPNTALRAITIQNSLFDIYKHHYIIKNKLEVLDKLSRAE